jgi:signal transduction histidine kinase
VTLRSRIVLSIVAISVILVVPAVLGLLALREVNSIARDLRTRDAVAGLALGRLQTAIAEVEHWSRVHLALGGQPGTERDEAWRRVETHASRASEEIERLEAAGYAEPVGPTGLLWQELEAALQRERAQVLAGQLDATDEFREQHTNPLLTRLNGTLEPVGAAINRGGEEQVRRAERVAAGAGTSALIALAVALTLAVLIGGWLTGSLLRPIGELRRGMAVVARGEFEPDIGRARERDDEIGELARSFEWMTSELRELERLRAEFISIASHELKTPLSVIKGYAALLRDGVYGEVSEKQQETMVAIGEQSDRLARLVQQLLDVSRFEAGGGRLELRSIELRAFLAALGRDFEVLAVQNEIDFQVECTAALPRTICADEDRLNEVLGNLLSNAFKFTPRGGRIRLNADASSGETVTIAVSDSGVGIPAEKLPRIFEKFYQVENTAQPRSVGSGLGLAISREIVDAHGGTIAAESEPGEGTTIRVELPVDGPPPEAA